MSRFAPGIAAFVAAISVALLGLYARADAPKQRAAEEGGTAKVRLLGVNDLHGHLQPPEPGIGGAAWLKAHMDAAALSGRTIRVHAGDMVGASPLISGWFHDEPAIEAANAIGFDVGTVGNHEFDEGGDELLRLLRGGRRQGPEAFKRDVDGRLVNTSSPRFAGAAFPYIGANTRERAGAPLLPPFAIEERAGVKVGFIGVTTPSTPKFLLRRHSERFRYTDMSDEVNRWVPELRRRGVEAIVVLAHAGAPDSSGGEIIGEARQMDAAVDVVIAGHSHSVLNLEVGGKLVIESGSYGRAYDLVDLEVDRDSGEVVAKRGEVPPTRHSGTIPDAGLAALVGRYAARIAPLGDHVLHRAPAPLGRDGRGLGDLVAAAQRSRARADAAIASEASMRGDIGAGPVTYAEVAEAQGYDHRVMRLTVTGAQLSRLRERDGEGLYYSGPRGPLKSRARYTLAVNEMLATGGALGELGAGRSVGNEVEVLAAYLERRRR